MLPDCECKGRAFLHSLQDFTEKKCEKISFASILSPHSIAKSAVKPIFSPLPHPTFFAPKSPFFPLFPVSNPISGTSSRNCSRFLPCEVHFFLVLPRFGAYFRRFFDGTSLFSAPNFNFPRFRALLQENSPFIIATLLFSHSVNAFPIRFFPFFILYPTFLFPLISFPPFIPPPSSLLPHFLSHSSPLFHLPPQ